jgi:hypothetical protein
MTKFLNPQIAPSPLPQLLYLNRLPHSADKSGKERSPIFYLFGVSELTI